MTVTGCTPRHLMKKAATGAFPADASAPAVMIATAMISATASAPGSMNGPWDYRRNETNETGTPSLPMDIMFIDTDIARGGYQGRWGDIGIEMQMSYNYVDHLMDNYSLRQASMMRRFTRTDVEAFGYKFRTFLDAFGGEFSLGADGNLATHNALINDPDNPMFFVNNFRDVNRDRIGAFAEWSGPLTDRLGAEFGLRYTRVNMNAGRVDGTPAQMMMGPQILRDRFNAADRNQHDNNVDWVVKLRYAVTDDLSVELGGARKTRSPSYQERYLWLPLQSTGGLADGRLYVGNINLKPEVAHQAELGLDWNTDRFYISPRAFYHHVDDYIQGIAATDPTVRMVAAANGELNPLEFSNVKARLYGADVEWGYYLSHAWHLHGILSYVRGERRDINDDLYRISPLRGSIALSYEQAHWSVTAEGIFFTRQNRVSATNLETKSSGYELLNLYGRYNLPGTGLSLIAGIENVLNTKYQPHLNGINRVADSDVMVGERVPGDGISGYIRASFEW
jgi:iron complex outermembrane recepter protein